jgi:hypothetical protein
MFCTLEVRTWVNHMHGQTIASFMCAHVSNLDQNNSRVPKHRHFAITDLGAQWVTPAESQADGKIDQGASLAEPFSQLLLVSHFPCDCRCRDVALVTDV